jgi:hypothetical protein
VIKCVDLALVRNEQGHFCFINMRVGHYCRAHLALVLQIKGKLASPAQQKSNDCFCYASLASS